MRIGLGTASFGTSISEESAHQIMDAYIALGGVIIDTANNYAFWDGHGGESETVIGTWLSKIQRDKVEVHTKIGAQPTDGNSFESAEGLTKSAIDSAIQASLNRLQTNYIDVLYAHLDDPSTPLLETWECLSEYVTKGTVKQLGISNYSAARVNQLSNVIQRYHLTPISFAQYRYSIIMLNEDADLGVQICFDVNLINRLKEANPNIKLLAYSPLLDGAFELGHTLPKTYNSKNNQAMIQQIQAEASQLNVNPSALVLKRIADSGITPLTMTSKVARLSANLTLFTGKSR